LHKTVLRIVTANLRMFVSRGVNAADVRTKKRGRAAARNSQTPSDEGNKQQ
jgi:hypothetical protein